MDYLRRGLWALSRAWRANSMSGHFGAPLVAVELLKRDRTDLDPAALNGLQHELDLMMADGEPWFDAAKADITLAELFEDAPLEGEPVPIEPLVEALGGSVDALRESGHNVIFAALALRGLKQRPELATAAMVDGLRRLLVLFQDSGPGRAHYGQERQWADPRSIPLADDPEPYRDELDMVDRTLQALIGHVAERRQGLGDWHHVINHAAAVVDLRRLGYEELAARGRVSHREHLSRFLALPDLIEELGPRHQAPSDPYTRGYWAWDGIERGSALLSHRPKTIYGFNILGSATDDDDLIAAGREALRYLM